MEVKLHGLSPILWTKNLEETKTFYETLLGFKAVSNFPDFVSLCRNEVQIMFVVPQDEPEDCKEPDSPEFFPKPTLTGSIYIYTDNVDSLWENVKEKAVVKSAIADRAYQMRDFSILDNNGYELVFGIDISKKEK
ncbi:MAG: VOC family protein [Cytophagales bacterium]|nr:VOC family protein [Cytophagales bacterium]